MTLAPETVLFYDGLCGLCDRLVQFLLDHDRSDRIFFMPIQSEAARKILVEKGVPECEIEELSTVYFLHQGVVFRRSRAVFHVLSQLPAPWGWARIFLIVPSCLMDPLYRLVARIRYRLFGRFDQCRIPTPAEKKRFLA